MFVASRPWRVLLSMRLPSISIEWLSNEVSTRRTSPRCGSKAELGEIQVRANASQLKRLLAWAAPFEERTWAVEGAGGCGYLLSQQLVAAGEAALDVPATLAARVRVLGSGKSNKNDPNDARSIAVAALRAPRLARVRPSDHASVLRLLAKRNSRLSSSRPERRVDFTHCWLSCSRADQPTSSRRTRPSGSWGRSSRRRRRRSPATQSRSSTSRTCAASTPSSPSPASGSSRLSPRREPR